jgi:3-polyprenyl-4-hydroxybenzoate decarboxylase
MVVFLYEMKYILAVTGASGIVYGVRLNEELKKGFEVYSRVTEGAKATAKYEFKDAIDRIKKHLWQFIMKQ